MCIRDRGAGMSSSAALESTYAFALNELFGEGKIDKFELAKVGPATEHNYCGVKCGITVSYTNLGQISNHDLEFLFPSNDHI